MNLLDLTKKICNDNEIKPARSKGQNFLIAEKIYDEIVEAAELDKNDFVLEVGPGLGFLTERLAARAGKVLAIELDDKLFKLARQRIVEQGIVNVEIVNDDILKLEIGKLGNWEIGKPEKSRWDLGSFTGLGNYAAYKIVANLPYNITSIFLRKFLSEKHKPESMTLMLQREVAERIVAKAGKMSLLAVSIQFYADAKIVRYVNKENFWPAPEVDSAVVQLRIKNEELRIKNINEKDFFRLVKIGFSAKRKMLKNNLANGFHIADEEATEKIVKAGFKVSVRAQELSVEDWVKLLEEFKDF